MRPLSVLKTRKKKTSRICESIVILKMNSKNPVAKKPSISMCLCVIKKSELGFVK